MKPFNAPHSASFFGAVLSHISFEIQRYYLLWSETLFPNGTQCLKVTMCLKVFCVTFLDCMIFYIIYFISYLSEVYRYFTWAIFRPTISWLGWGMSHVDDLLYAQGIGKLCLFQVGTSTWTRPTRSWDIILPATFFPATARLSYSGADDIYPKPDDTLEVRQPAIGGASEKNVVTMATKATCHHRKSSHRADAGL